jgi:hypothetical protein
MKERVVPYSQALLATKIINKLIPMGINAKAGRFQAIIKPTSKKRLVNPKGYKKSGRSLDKNRNTV